MKFRNFAWSVLAYNLVVILWGALVRATGSGAGCGSHWPLCNGEVVPRAESLETIIEFSHRLTSGLALIFVLVLYFWARKKYNTSDLPRKWAFISLILILVEALIGASLVLLELVADNVSVARAGVLGFHLVNTFFLIAALSFTAWYAHDDHHELLKKESTYKTSLSAILLLLIVVGATGAITALGDTVFPSESLAEGIAADFDPNSSFLVRLRVIHPVLAILASIFVFFVGWKILQSSAYPKERLLAKLALTLVATQVVFGFVNLLLLVPVWSQLVHLLLADFSWISIALLWSIQHLE